MKISRINYFSEYFSEYFWNTLAFIYQCFLNLHDCTFKETSNLISLLHENLSHHLVNIVSILDIIGNIKLVEAVVWRCSAEKMFLEIFQRSATLLKKRLWQRCYLVNFTKILRAPFLKPPVAASDLCNTDTELCHL